MSRRDREGLADEIAIKTAEINELKNINLMDSDCKIRYIITINALKEGWDCPFAYILASLANRNSPVDVEQLLGRILRQPYTKHFADETLNKSYVFTSSENFRATLDNIVKTLNSEGFSSRDCRAVDEGGEIINGNNGGGNYGINYDNDKGKNDKDVEGEGRIKLNSFPMRKEFRAGAIILPQLFIKNQYSMFDEEYFKIDRNKLCEKFSLTQQNAEIDFDINSLNAQAAAVDIDDDNVPRYRNLKQSELTELNGRAKYFDKDLQSPEQRLNACIRYISAKINKNKKYDNLANRDIKDYVMRALSILDAVGLRSAFLNYELYADLIMNKIDGLMSEHAGKVFKSMTDLGEISAQPSFKLSDQITPVKYTTNLKKSLYEAEDNNINDFEHKAVMHISSLDNILWWHRNRERKGFFINGFINHYPDFIVRTKNGVTVIVETKGAQLANPDSKLKLELGTKWADMAGDKYKYFMVFDYNESFKGALTFDNFMSTIAKL